MRNTHLFLEARPCAHTWDDWCVLVAHAESSSTQQLPLTVVEEQEGSRASFPLGLCHATHYVKERVALVGSVDLRILAARLSKYSFECWIRSLWLVLRSEHVGDMTLCVCVCVCVCVWTDAFRGRTSPLPKVGWVTVLQCSYRVLLKSTCAFLCFVLTSHFFICFFVLFFALKCFFFLILGK